MSVNTMYIIASVLTYLFAFLWIRSVIDNLSQMKPIVPNDEDTRTDHQLASFQRLTGSMVFTSMSFIMMTLSAGAAVYLEKPNDILLWAFQVAGVLFVFNWFIRIIMMRDGILDFVAIIIGLGFLYVAAGFSVTYTAFAALFVVALTTIRLSIWWYAGGREVASEKVNMFEKNSFLSGIFAWLVITIWRIKR